MSSKAVDRIIESTHFKETIDGVEFVLRKLTGGLSVQALGNKTLGLVRAGAIESDKEVPAKRQIEMMEAYLVVCMVSPKIGDDSDPEEDTISLRDLGDWGPKILTAIFRESGFGELENVDGFSEDTKDAS